MSALAGPPLLSFTAPGVARVTLRRPQHLNRLHAEDLFALQTILSTLAADTELRLLILSGQGRMFCAGLHLGELKDTAVGADAGPALFEQTVDALEALPVPTIARLNGSVFGGATDLALACDFRVGVLGMRLRMPAARLGLHYYPSGLRRYVSRLGLSAAKRLFLLADELEGDELLRIGYLDALVAQDQLDAQVDARAQSLLAGAPLALAGMKASLNEIARGECKLEKQREREARCAASADLKEGLAAYAQKRAPRFSGR